MRAFQHAAAVEVRGPVRRVDQGLLRVLVERLRHQRDEVLRDARVFEKRLYDGVGQARLLVCETARALRRLFARGRLTLVAHPADPAPAPSSSAYQLPRTSG